MKKQLSSLLMVALTTASGMALAKESKPSHKPATTQSAVLKDDNAKVSYGIGMDIGKNFKRLALDVDLKVLIQGLQDGYAGNASQIPADELSAIMSRYQNELRLLQSKILGQPTRRPGKRFWRKMLKSRVWLRCLVACNIKFYRSVRAPYPMTTAG